MKNQEPGTNDQGPDEAYSRAEYRAGRFEDGATRL
jgi:hypothetical protein